MIQREGTWVTWMADTSFLPARATTLITSEIEGIIMKNRQIFHRHPVSTTLLLFYLFTSFIQGDIELFFAGLLAAAGAFGLEFMFYVTGAIGMRRRRAGISAGRNMYDGGNKTSKAYELHIASGAQQRDSLSSMKIITIQRRV